MPPRPARPKPPAPRTAQKPPVRAAPISAQEAPVPTPAAPLLNEELETPFEEIGDDGDFITPTTLQTEERKRLAETLENKLSADNSVPAGIDRPARPPPQAGDVFGEPISPTDSVRSETHKSQGGLRSIFGRGTSSSISSTEASSEQIAEKQRQLGRTQLYVNGNIARSTPSMTSLDRGTGAAALAEAAAVRRVCIK